MKAFYSMFEFNIGSDRNSSALADVSGSREFHYNRTLTAILSILRTTEEY
jgi:hypothetical protein